MKILSIIMISLFLSLFSCKKKDHPLESEEYTIEKSARISCWYDVFDSTAIGKGVTRDSTMMAVFYNPCFMGAIAVNTVELDTYPSGCDYRKTNEINMHLMNWSIGGNGGISPFNFSCTPSHALFTGENLLPDTLSKGNFSFVINGVSNVDEKRNYLAVYQGNLAGLNYLPRSYPATATVSSSDQDLAKFVPDSPIEIQLSLGNSSEMTIDGRSYTISTARYYHKYVYLKP